MFTGIIQQLGRVLSVKTFPHGLLLSIEHTLNDLVRGESIAVNGVCLTVTESSSSHVVFFLSPETVKITTFSSLKAGQPVHLERALCMGDSVSGHWVSGHVDGQLRVQDRKWFGDSLELVLGGIPNHAIPWLIPKGSVALNGVSLTLNHVTPDHISLMLIPETVNKTTLGDCEVGDCLHVEYDMMAKTSAHQLQYFLKTQHTVEVLDES